MYYPYLEMPHSNVVHRIVKSMQRTAFAVVHQYDQHRHVFLHFGNEHYVPLTQIKPNHLLFDTSDFLMS